MRALLLVILFLPAGAMAQTSELTNELNFYGQAPFHGAGSTVRLKSTSGILDTSERQVEFNSQQPVSIRLDREAGVNGSWWKFELTSSGNTTATIWARKDIIRINGDQFSIPGAQLVPPQEFSLSGARSSAQKGMARQVIEVRGCYRSPTAVTGLFGKTYHCEGRQVSEQFRCNGQSRVEMIRSVTENQISLIFTPNKGQAFTLTPAAIPVPVTQLISKTPCQPRPNEPDIQFNDRGAVR
jgi:hypothetical protein